MDIASLTSQIPRLDQISPYGSDQRSWRPPFTVGQFLRGEIAGTAGDDRFFLDIGQQRFTAASSLPLTTGIVLDLQVIATEPQLALRVLADPLAQRIGGSLHLLPAMDGLLPLLQTLADSPTFLAFLAPEEQQLLAAWLATGQKQLAPGSGDQPTLPFLLQSLGLQQERQLAEGRPNEVQVTIKQILLQAAANGQLPAEVREQAASMVQLIDLFQMLRLRLESTDLLFFPLMLPFLEQGYLLVDRDAPEQEQQSGGTRKNYCSLILRLGGLGNLRIDMAPGPEGLVLTFRCEDQEKARFMALFREELLAGVSSTVQGVSFLTGAQDPVQQLLMADTSAGSSPLLDTRA